MTVSKKLSHECVEYDFKSYSPQFLENIQSQKWRILILEDEILISLVIKNVLLNFLPKCEIFHVDNTAQALQLLANEKIDIAIIDLNLQGIFNGFDVIRAAKNQQVYNVVLSGYYNQITMEKAYQSGTYEFFNKVDVKKSGYGILDCFLKQQYQEFQLERWHQLTGNDILLSTSPFEDSLHQLVKKASPKEPFLLVGETGTGKTILAKKLHQFLAPNTPFVELNCAAIQEDLLESELFGYAKGAFTGALVDYPGKLVAANGGVLFLDEINSAGMKLQKKLLKCIEEKEFYPVGSNQKKKVNFILISASNEKLPEKIARSEFRLDLYHRLRTQELNISPIRMRINDAYLYIHDYISRLPRRIFHPSAEKIIENYSWPGNYRELKDFCHLFQQQDSRMLTEQLAKDLIARLQGFQPFSFENQSLENVSNQNITNQQSEEIFEKGFLSEKQKEYIYDYGWNHFLKESKHEIWQYVLFKQKGNRLASLKQLGVSRNWVYHKGLKTLEIGSIEPPSIIPN